MIEYKTTLQQWQQLSHSIREPQNETEYDELLEFARKLSSEHSIEREPMKGLFWLIAQYLGAWEREHDPWNQDAKTTA
jgi:hypothetical protein